MRGTWEHFTCFLGAWSVSTLWPNLREGKGREGRVEAMPTLASPGLRLCRVWQPHERVGPIRKRIVNRQSPC
jgi:hypothetical protein